MLLEDEIRALEERLLEPEVRGSAEELDRLLAEDFLEFGKSGRTFDKKQIVAALTREPEPPLAATTDAFRARRLAENVVLATYRVESAAGRSLRSSIWIHREGRWQLLFHQGTRSDQTET